MHFCGIRGLLAELGPIPARLLGIMPSNMWICSNKNDTFLGIMPSKVSVPGRTCTFLGIMPSNAWGLQAECGMLLGMMPSNAPGFG